MIEKLTDSSEISFAKSARRISFSAIQPSGAITLGNYLGAVRSWTDLQRTHSCIFAIADCHAVTVPKEPHYLRSSVRNLLATLLACGISPDESLLFLQSTVSHHTQLGWLLECNTQYGELRRMTQFKSKSQQNENFGVGLFTYPCLMAADILLYNTDDVPVGTDQTQHVEFARNVAQRFNSRFGETFKLPEPMFPKNGAKIMSLTDPSRKMSKSSDNSSSYILLCDHADLIVQKIKGAVTDSGNQIKYIEGKGGLNNLIVIYSCLSGLSFEQISFEFEGKGYGTFKSRLAEIIVSEFEPIQREYSRLIECADYLETCVRRGAESARKLAQPMLERAMYAMGYWVP
ncbi:MAG: tryptophan--tRNA ligase [Oscillospiraceae bacterium]|jgi:tryptophanyl-tRNA synthetase|nr:tryptophan--tRNA ligase [Oscillospiraceae bacterium]